MLAIGLMIDRSYPVNLLCDRLRIFFVHQARVIGEQLPDLGNIAIGFLVCGRLGGDNRGRSGQGSGERHGRDCGSDQYLAHRYPLNGQATRRGNGRPGVKGK